jgi:hypothetical protein
MISKLSPAYTYRGSETYVVSQLVQRLHLQACCVAPHVCRAHCALAKCAACGRATPTGGSLPTPACLGAYTLGAIAELYNTLSQLSRPEKQTLGSEAQGCHVCSECSLTVIKLPHSPTHPTHSP